MSKLDFEGDIHRGDGMRQPEVRHILEKEYGITNDTYVKYVYDGYTYQGKHQWIRKPKTQNKIRIAFHELGYSKAHAQRIVEALVDIDTFDPQNYDEAREMVNEKIWDRAWQLCHMEFKGLWFEIKMSDKRDLVMEKYILMCRARVLQPFLKYRPQFDS